MGRTASSCYQPWEAQAHDPEEQERGETEVTLLPPGTGRVVGCLFLLDPYLDPGAAGAWARAAAHGTPGRQRDSS